jgi:hypothetical protein
MHNQTLNRNNDNDDDNYNDFARHIGNQHICTSTLKNNSYLEEWNICSIEDNTLRP